MPSTLSQHLKLCGYKALPIIQGGFKLIPPRICLATEQRKQAWGLLVLEPGCLLLAAFGLRATKSPGGGVLVVVGKLCQVITHQRALGLASIHALWRLECFSLVQGHENTRMGSLGIHMEREKQIFSVTFLGDMRQNCLGGNLWGFLGKLRVFFF